MNHYQELLQADYSTLEQMCLSNAVYNDICSNDDFWKDKITYQLGPDFLNAKSPNLSWYDYYISHYKVIIPIDEENRPIGKIYTTSYSTVRELILGIIQMMGKELHGNYIATIKIGPYIMHSDNIANVWTRRLCDLGVLGYLIRDDKLGSYPPHLTDRTEIWSVLDQAEVKIFPLILRTQSKARHSYLKLSFGKLLGAESITQKS